LPNAKVIDLHAYREGRIVSQKIENKVGPRRHNYEAVPYECLSEEEKRTTLQARKDEEKL
jgi:hypothetical protein